MIISEAGALGTPSITYDAPGTRDAVDYGRAGYLCKGKNAKAIVACMESALSDSNKYRKIQQRAWEFSNKLSFEKTGTDFYNLLCLLLNKDSN